jgi:8-oxo-dGTP pyrophosphatase MutT (NUDIX family)
MQNKSGAGAMFISMNTHRILLNIRAPYKTHALEWSLWGGMIEPNETPISALLRELKEEMNFISSDIVKTYPFDIYHTRDYQFSFYSFLCIVEEEFTPQLNKENCGYGWFDMDYKCWPRPLHKGVAISYCNDRARNRMGIIIGQHSS